MYQSCNSFGDIHSCYTEVTGVVAGRGGVVILWRRGCGGTVSPRLGSDGLVNLVVTIRIRFTGYTRETSIANKR